MDIISISLISNIELNAFPFVLISFSNINKKFALIKSFCLIHNSMCSCFPAKSCRPPAACRSCTTFPKHFTVKSANSTINVILVAKGDVSRDGVQSEHPQEDHGHQR